MSSKLPWGSGPCEAVASAVEVDNRPVDAVSRPETSVGAEGHSQRHPAACPPLPQRPARKPQQRRPPRHSSAKRRQRSPSRAPSREVDDLRRPPNILSVLPAFDITHPNWPPTYFVHPSGTIQFLRININSSLDSRHLESKLKLRALLTAVTKQQHRQTGAMSSTLLRTAPALRAALRSRAAAPAAVMASTSFVRGKATLPDLPCACFPPISISD